MRSRTISESGYLTNHLLIAMPAMGDPNFAQTVASTSRVIDPAGIVPSGREATNCSVQLWHIVCPPMANEPRIGTEP